MPKKIFPRVIQIALCLVLSAYSISSEAQTDSIDFDIAAFVTLDSFVITAQRGGFNVDEFIQMVQEDETFHQAFKNLRTISYSADNDIDMFSKKQIEIAAYQSTTHQKVKDNCRMMDYQDEQTTGKFYKKKRRKKKKRKKSYRYYTAKMYDRLFFTHGKKCQGKGSGEAVPAKGMEKHVQELKKLIFNPGQKADVPLIGEKTAIFDEKMVKFYDYSINSEFYNNTRDCYVFTVTVKPEYQKKQKKKTVIKHLETYFDKENFQVVARNYTLAYSGGLFDFDIDMRIRLQKIGDLYVPSFLSYDGWWNVPTKKRETSKFEAKFYDFQP